MSLSPGEEAVLHGQSRLPVLPLLWMWCAWERLRLRHGGPGQGLRGGREVRGGEGRGRSTRGARAEAREDPNRSLYEINAFAQSWFRERFLDADDGAEARAYLEGRGIGLEVAERFGIGFVEQPDLDLVNLPANQILGLSDDTFAQVAEKLALLLDRLPRRALEPPKRAPAPKRRPSLEGPGAKGVRLALAKETRAVNAEVVLRALLTKETTR